MTRSSTQFETTWDRSAISSAGDDVVLMVRITPNGPAVTKSPSSLPVDVAFALDRSGSMAGQPIQLVKQAVERGAKLLSERDRLALVVYDDRIETIHPLQAVNAPARLALQAGLAGIDARGSTNLGGGWMQACLQLADSAPLPGNARGPRLQRTLLLTDGLANVGITDASELAGHAVELRMRGITTSTLGVGEHFDELLLSGMAEAGGGNFQYIPAATHLAEFFSKELGRLLATVASGLTISFQTSVGLNPDVISSFPFTRTGGGWTMTIGEIAEGEDTIVLVRLATPVSEIGQTVAVKLTCSWIEAATGQPHSSVLEAPVLTVVLPESPLLSKRDAMVAEQAALQQAARDQREAMRLDRAGRYQESRSMHRRIAVDLAAAPATDVVRERLVEAQAFGEYSAHGAMPEDIRKQSVHANYRRARGRSDLV